MTETPELFARLYDELHAIAIRRLAGETRGHLLQPADLLHEVYLRLARADSQPWESAEAFYATAAATMRRVLIDQARTRNTIRRGGRRTQIFVEVDELLAEPRQVEMLDIERVLDDMAGEHPEYVRLVEVRFFGGLSERQAADALGLSIHEVRRAWREARRIMRRRLG